jgi:hypothetical protein
VVPAIGPEGDLTAGGLQCTDNRARERGLSTAAFANQSERFTGKQVESYRVNCPDHAYDALKEAFAANRKEFAELLDAQDWQAVFCHFFCISSALMQAAL